MAEFDPTRSSVGQFAAMHNTTTVLDFFWGLGFSAREEARLKWQRLLVHRQRLCSGVSNYGYLRTRRTFG